MKIRHVIAGAAALTAATAHGQYTLTILHANDTESQLLHAGTPSADISAIPTSSASDLQNYGGAARFVALLEKLRSEAATDGVITISAGDNYLPGIELDASSPTKNPDNSGGGYVHYDALLFAAAGFDVSTIGNHEFDLGPEYFQSWVGYTENTNSSAIPGVEVPFVSANLDLSAYPDLAADVSPSVIINKGGEMIGVIGGTTPLLPGISSIGDTVMIDKDGDQDSDLDDLAALVQAEVDSLTQEGVNKIILVTHLQNIRNEQELVKKIRGVDVVIGGGGNELLSNDGNPIIPGTTVFGPYPLLTDAHGASVTDLDGKNVPVIVANGDMRFVGRAVVTFDAEGNVTAFEGNPVLVTALGDNAVAPDADVMSEIVMPVYDYVVELNSTIIANSEVALNGLRTAVRNRETNLGNLVADSILYAARDQAPAYAPEYSLPVVALQNGGGIRNDSVIAAGNLTLGTLNSVLPFTNYVSIVPNVSGAQLKEIAEHAVARAGQTGGQFGQIAGMHIVYNPRNTAQVTATNGASVTTPGNRVVSLTLTDGTQVVVDGVVQTVPPVTIATINFLAAGGDNYPFYGLSKIDTPVLYQDALRMYVEDELKGEISSAEYPEGGDGRIVSVTGEALLDATIYDSNWSLSSWMGYYFAPFYPYVWWPATDSYIYISPLSTNGAVWAYVYDASGSSGAWAYLAPLYYANGWIWYSDSRGWVDTTPSA